MAAEPRILAAFVQGTLDTARRFERGAGADVAGRLAPETLRAIEAAMPVTWLPLRHDVELTEALFDAAGTEGACGVFREAMASSMHKGFMAPLVRGAVSLLGRSPERLLRWTPRFWATIYRDAGELTPAPTGSEHVFRLELLHAPPLLQTHRRYLYGTTSAIEGALAGVGVEVRCTLDERAAAPAFLVSWKPGA